jgi:sodium-coupled neutral amino acid transporter 9
MVYIYHIAFTITWVLYTLIGVFGAMALSQTGIKEGSTLLDFFQHDDPFALTLRILVALQLSLLLPLIHWVMRSRLFEMTNWHNKHRWVFTIIFCLIALSCQILNVELQVVLGYAGYIQSH